MDRFPPSPSRREFVLAGSAAAALTALGCDEEQKKAARNVGAFAASAGTLLAFAPDPGLQALAVLLKVGGATITLAALVAPSERADNPVVTNYGVTPVPDRSVPAGTIRVVDRRDGRDITDKVCVDPADRDRLPGRLTTAPRSPTLRYTCPQQVRSLPFAYHDVVWLKQRARMLNVWCEDRPTPAGQGAYTIRYGGRKADGGAMGWQERSFANAAEADRWHRILSAAPGFAAEVTEA